MLARSLLAGLTMMLAQPATGMDLEEAWGLLKRQGPSFLAAEHEREAGRENRALGLAGLLPQVTASAYKNRVDGTSEHPDIFGREQTTPLNYDSQGGSLQLRQPLLNWPKMAEYRQGEQKARYSEAVFDAKTQDAAVELAGRYLDVLLARETITMADMKVKAFEEQRAASQRRFDLGDGTVTDIDEATARRDLAQAERLEAQNNLQTSLRLLQELLGDMPTRIAGLQPASFATPPLAPAALADWLAEAETHNPALHARQRAYDVAQEEYNRVYGQHLPSVDFVLGYTVGDSESLSTLNQRNRYSTIGVQINIPVFSGGYISAQSRQAAANREKAREELNAARAKVMSNTTREFNNVQSGEARVRALETAVVSSERALRSARMGFRAGTSTNVDILNAEEKLFTARHDLLETKLRYLMAQLRLRSAVGTLGDPDIERVNNYLGPELPL